MITNEQDKMDNLILCKTKLTKKKLKEIKARKQDYYFSAKEAVELSFADAIFMPTDWTYITGVQNEKGNKTIYIIFTEMASKYANFSFMFSFSQL